MADLTKEQMTFLSWLAQGNQIDVCIELCPDLSKITGVEIYTSSCNGHFQKRTLFKLKALGFISERVHYITGIRYLSCTLSQRGIDWLSSNIGLAHA